MRWLYCYCFILVRCRIVYSMQFAFLALSPTMSYYVCTATYYCGYVMYVTNDNNDIQDSKIYRALVRTLQRFLGELARTLLRSSSRLIVIFLSFHHFWSINISSQFQISSKVRRYFIIIDNGQSSTRTNGSQSLLQADPASLSCHSYPCKDEAYSAGSSQIYQVSNMISTTNILFRGTSDFVVLTMVVGVV